MYVCVYVCVCVSIGSEFFLFGLPHSVLVLVLGLQGKQDVMVVQFFLLGLSFTLSRFI